MKKSALVLSLVFATSGLALAQDTVKEAPKAPAKHASKHLAAKHEVAGEVVSIDAEKKTVTFTNEKGEGKALASLKSVKAGDKVTIHYAVDAKGAPKSATEITSAPVAQVKPATPVKNATAATTAKSDAPKTEAPKAEAPKPNDKK
jgi:hypothetical protein